MTYRVEFSGDDIDLMTLDQALDWAKNAIANEVGPISGWTVEHDDTINDWFVQGVRNGTPVGPFATINGPEPTIAAPPVRTDDPDGWVRCVSFSGNTAADAFGLAASWLAGRAAVVTVADTAWNESRRTLRLYLHED